MWYGIVLTIGLLMLAISIYLLSARVHFLRNGVVTTGTVVEVLKRKDSDGEMEYRPVFKFKTQTGKEVIFKYIFSAGSPNWTVGEEVRLVYNDHSPKKAIVLTYVGSFGYVIILTAIALPLIVVGGGYYLAEYFFRLI